MFRNQNNIDNQSGLILEGLIFVLFFLISTFGIYFLFTRKLDQSHSYRQAQFDLVRGSFQTELPILIFTSAGYPELRPADEVIEVLTSAKRSSALHSLVKLPFCAGVIEAKNDQLNGQIEYRLLSEYQIECNQFINSIPTCVKNRIQEFSKANAKNLSYFVMGFYVKDNAPFNEQCAVARAVAHEVEPPVVFEPSYFEIPTPSVTQEPSIEPSFSPSLIPTITPSNTPSVSSTPESSINPSDTPTPSQLPSIFVTPAPSIFPSIAEPSLMPTITTSAIPTLFPSQLPMPTPSILTDATPGPSTAPCIAPTQFFNGEATSILELLNKQHTDQK